MSDQLLDKCREWLKNYDSRKNYQSLVSSDPYAGELVDFIMDQIEPDGSDAYDRFGKRLSRCVFETAKVADRMAEPFRSGAILALEEVCFRFTGQHWDWNEAKCQLESSPASAPQPEQQERPQGDWLTHHLHVKPSPNCHLCPGYKREPSPEVPSEVFSDLSERVAQLTAHRACCGTEHDPVNGKLHGYCVVCGVPWPCEYAGKPPNDAASLLRDALSQPPEAPKEKP